MKKVFILTWIYMGVVFPGISQPWSYNFGTGTGAYSTASTSSTTFLPAAPNGNDFVRIGSAGGSINLENPGLSSFGSNTEVRLVAPTSTSVNKLSVYDFASASDNFYIKFSMILGNSTGGTTVPDGKVYFFSGDGARFSSGSSFSTSEVFSGLQFTFGSSGTITTKYRNGSSWTATGITGTPVSQGVLAEVEVYCNNSAGAVSYYKNGSSNSIASAKWDFWVNGSLVGDDLNVAGLVGSNVIDSWMFYGISSTSNAANLFLDDIVYSNSLPTTIYNSSVWSNGTPNEFTDAVFAQNYTLTSGQLETDELIINSGISVIINPSTSIIVNGQLTNNNGTSGLTIKSTSSGTGSLIETTTAISATVERYLTVTSTGKNHFLSAPISAATISNILDGTLGNYNAYKYDPSQVTNKWVRVYSSENMIIGAGYCIPYSHASTNSKTISYSGTINTGLLEPAISSTTDDWNLIGNPYPCSISPVVFLNENAKSNHYIKGAVYFWDESTSPSSNDYATCNFTGTTKGNNLGGTDPDSIALGQGFFVQSKNTSPTKVTFNNSMKSAFSGNFFIVEPAQISSYYFAMMGKNDIYNEILIGFPTKSTAGIDNLYDAPKLRGNNSIAFYSLIEDKEFAIQGYPPGFEQLDIPLGYDIAAAGNYTISLSQTENTGLQDVYLEDKNTGQKMLLNSGNFYSFYSTAGKFNDRFVLHFLKISGVKNEENNKFNIPVNTSGNTLFLDFNNWKNFPARYLITDVSGKTIAMGNIGRPGTKQVEINATGLFIVKIQSGGQSQINKIVVRGN